MNNPNVVALPVFVACNTPEMLYEQVECGQQAAVCIAPLILYFSESQQKKNAATAALCNPLLEGGGDLKTLMPTAGNI